MPLRSGETGDNVGARNEEEILLEEEGKEKLIKTIQRRTSSSWAASLAARRLRRQRPLPEPLHRRRRPRVPLPRSSRSRGTRLRPTFGWRLPLTTQLVEENSVSPRHLEADPGRQPDLPVLADLRQARGRREQHHPVRLRAFGMGSVQTSDDLEASRPSKTTRKTRSPPRTSGTPPPTSAAASGSSR